MAPEAAPGYQNKAAWQAPEAAWEAAMQVQVRRHIGSQLFANYYPTHGCDGTPAVVGAGAQIAKPAASHESPEPAECGPATAMPPWRVCCSLGVWKILTLGFPRKAPQEHTDPMAIDNRAIGAWVA